VSQDRQRLVLFTIKNRKKRRKRRKKKRKMVA
jgi:hypothetical protein